MSRKEFVQNRVNMIWVNLISDIQSIIQENIIQTESKETLNKIYKKESLKLVEDMIDVF